MAPKGKAKAKAKAATSSPGRAKGDAASPKKAPAVNAEAVASEVLRLGSAGQHESVLRVLGDDVSASSSAAAARKAFLRISMLIHPDKLPGFADATKAFQCLISALDRLQAKTPDSAAPAKGTALGRSSEGCYRTEVLCPRCQVPWGEGGEGNPDYYYNFMMQGLRRFNCCTCLLTFGCLTAVHRCPFCKSTFDYDPDKYHSKVKCDNASCGKSFGFMMYHASERALKAARDQVRDELERQARTEAAKEGRAARAARRAGGSAGPDATQLFKLGLSSVCPKCGLELEDYEDGEQLQHLRVCNDGAAHAAHKARQQSRATAEKKAAEQAKAQHSRASSAVWSFVGGRVRQLWMLDAESLKKRCSQEGLSQKGNREVLIERLVAHLGHRKDGGVFAEDLPAALHSQSDEALAAVCASHGLKDLSDRGERLEALESLRMEALEDGRSTRKKAPAAIKGPAPALALMDGKASPRPKKANPAKQGGVGAKLKAKAKAKGLATKQASKPKGAAPKAKAKGKAKALAGKRKRGA